MDNVGVRVNVRVRKPYGWTLVGHVGVRVNVGVRVSVRVRIKG